jgi:hypothetical protein
MRCSCGWTDPTRRTTDVLAIGVANTHIRAVQEAAAPKATAARKVNVTAVPRTVTVNVTPASRTPPQRATPQQVHNRRIFALVLLVVLAGVIIGLVVSNHPTSYGDGYQWGQGNTIGVLSKTAPSCSYSEMTSRGSVDDSKFFYHKPLGANEPHDDFSQWQSGCEAGAQAVIKSFNSP